MRKQLIYLLEQCQILSVQKHGFTNKGSTNIEMLQFINLFYDKLNQDIIFLWY